MSMLGAVLMPHPPVLLPEVGRGRESEIAATERAMRAAAEAVAHWAPDVLVVASPHTVMYSDYFHISPGKSARGDMSAFGAPQLQVETEYDAQLREEMIRLARDSRLEAGTLGQRGEELDHGTLIPLYYLRRAGVSCPIVRVGLSGFSPSEHYRLGRCAARAAEKLGRRAVFVASGDLSHKLRADGPYGFAPEGPAFDEAVTGAMASGDFLSFLAIEPSLCERAAECGLRAFQMMSGALDGLAVAPELLSHEGPFGVGYAVALFPVTGRDEGRRFEAAYERVMSERADARRSGEDAWVRLARLSLETYVRTGQSLDTLPDGLPAELTGRAAGAFVSLHAGGRLRGCIGTIAPTAPSVASEIINNAVSAATADPRFDPVEKEELAKLVYSVDILGETEKIDSAAKLDVKRYGVIVTKGGRRGLLLPNLEGVDSVEEQISIAKKKAGIGANDKVQLERFEVVRHH